MTDRASGAAAVVGASGFIGSSLARRLQADGVPVGSFTRTVPFMSDAEHLARGVETSETVFWLAASVNPAVAEERPDLVDHDQSQFEALLRSLEAARPVPRIILLSSGGTVYDPSSEPPYHEDSAVKGTTAYSRAKLALEAALRAANIPDRCKVVVRAANAYGPGQPARRGQGVIAHWLHAALDRRPLVLLGDPDTVRDYVHVDDLVEALSRLHAHRGDLPPVLNVGSGKRTSLGELADTVVSVVDDTPLAVETRPARSFDLPSTWLDVELAARTIGWRPEVVLREGIASAWRHLRDRAAVAAGL
jgi:UDP-glucose 4-epimerase